MFVSENLGNLFDIKAILLLYHEMYANYFEIFFLKISLFKEQKSGSDGSFSSDMLFTSSFLPHW